MANGPRMGARNVCLFVVKVAVKFGGFLFRGFLVSKMALCKFQLLESSLVVMGPP